jgi:alpha-galactosidase
MFPALFAAVLCAATVLTATVASGASAAPAAQGAGQGYLQDSQSYNGTALTPPMGFNSWYQYRCGISETIVLATAGALVSSGMAKLGYEYVNLDDCWAAPTRAADGQLQSDPTRFPHGIQWLADQVHAMGLKLGIYESVGTTTCQGLPGSFGHYQQDADTFASWGVDFVKFDTCGSVEGTDISADYQQMSQDLLATGRPIVYSEELPIAAGNANSSNPQYLPLISLSSSISNMWRIAPDLYPNFDGTVFGHLTEDLPLAAYAHPGAWNDLDMLVTGTSEFQWTAPEEQTQMSIWAELASPLIVSSDLTNMSAVTKQVLSNKAVIAVDQDPLGKQGYLVAQDGPVYTVAKPLANGGVAVLFANTSSVPQQASTTARAAGLPNTGAYAVRNLWAHTTRESAGAITALVPAASAVLYRVSPLRSGAGGYAPVSNVSVAAAAAMPGQTVTVPATFTNDGRQAVTDASLSLKVPRGWKVSGTPVAAGAIPGGRQLSGSWQVTVPPGTQASYYTVTAAANYHWSTTHTGSQSSQGSLEVGNALIGYTADEFALSQSYPPYGSQLTPLYRDMRSDGTPTLLPGSPIQVGSDPSGVAATPNGKYVYVTDHGSKNVDVIDTATNAVVATVPVGAGPYGIAVTPDGKHAYVADNGSNNVDVIDTATNTVTATIPVGAQPYGLAITPDGTTAYVSNQGANTVSPIDTTTDTAGTPIPVGTAPRQIAITPNGSTAYVANMGSASVTPISTATNTAGTSITVPCSGPDGVGIDPANSTLYVACFGASGINPATYGAVVPINTATNQPGTPIRVSAHPEGIAADSSGSTLYAADAFQSTITPVHAATGVPELPIHVPGAYGIALLPTGSG